ncbi:arginine N-succinyltransferase [Candidatus Marinamargulisbacteria bacterium SCGC AG-333-B06]|nr:arginine N-succinyltransferase [Candidatus Marinamargulisbacteria bacterium SCGC AG-333-B06]
MIENLIVRPIELKDLEDVYELSLEAKHGLSTLPKDKELLAEKIQKSVDSFHHHVGRPSDELYVFVLVDLTTKKVVGLSGILANVGHYDSFYTYQRGECYHKDSKHSSATHQVLTLSKEPFHASELCTLYLHPRYRHCGAGRFLSLVRFLYMASHGDRFRSTLIAELRGISNDDGSCPFWDVVMKPFFEMTFFEADEMSQKSRDFIGEYIPKTPIYIDLLPHSVQAIIGQVHPLTVAAERLLISEGFSKTDYLDIFDSGPKYAAKLDQIKAYNRIKPCETSTISSGLGSKNMYIVSAGHGEHFIYGCVQAREQGALNSLCVKETDSMKALFDFGNILSYMRLHPKVRRSQQVSAPVMNQMSLSHSQSFSKLFSKWHDRVVRDEHYTFYR